MSVLQRCLSRCVSQILRSVQLVIHSVCTLHHLLYACFDSFYLRSVDRSDFQSVYVALESFLSVVEVLLSFIQIRIEICEILLRSSEIRRESCNSR